MSRALSIIATALLLAVCVAHGAAAPASERNVTLAQYRDAIQQAAAAVVRLGDHPEEALSLHRSLPDKFIVSEGGRAYTVDLTSAKLALGEYTVAQAPRRATLLAQIQARFDILREGAAQFTSNVDTQAAHRQLTAILSRREFHSVQGPTLLEIWRDKIAHYFISLLDRLFAKMPGSEQGNRILVWLLIAITSCVLAVWLYRMARQKPIEFIREVIPFSPSARGWRSWLVGARAAADAGHWRDAIHLAYWAGISNLEEHGAWIPDRARTPREYLRLISANHQWRPVLNELTRKFEVVWYGDRPAGAEDYRQTLEYLERLGCTTTR